MKIAIIGAAGVRTPLIVQSITARQERLGLDELALMDIDASHLELIGLLSETPGMHKRRYAITRTTDARQALAGADFVITTFRVGGIASRVIDERVPLNFGVLGQETTGPGGFAMALRSIPVLLNYIDLMEEVCPHAWLINFANPAGLLVEAVTRLTGWKRVAGICDAPSGMARLAAAVLHANPEHVYLDYFGLNHLGWVRSLRWQGQEYLPTIFQMLREGGSLPFLPFDTDFMVKLGLIPNEYLYYFYHTVQAVDNILRSPQSRGEQIAALNLALFAALAEKHAADDLAGMQRVYQSYLKTRGDSYMTSETGHTIGLENLDPQTLQAITGEGYAGVALDLIEGLLGRQPRHMILNIPNQGAMPDLAPEDVVEVPAYVNAGMIQPLAVGPVPEHCMDLINQVKIYEKLTVEAVKEHSYHKALAALAGHPLVPDPDIAEIILDGYIRQHGVYFPELKK